MSDYTWSRREWLSSMAVGAAGITKLDGFYYRDYSRCLPNYLTALARAAYEKRNRALALLTDAPAIHRRQLWARETLWKLIGAQLEKTPLNARTIGAFEREGYRVEKVVYESRPQLFISANLYVPTVGKPPFPGVLFQMGHSANGKAYASYQKCCQGLARLGYMVLAFDPMGQGERIGYPDSSGSDTRLSSVDEEHTLPGRQMLLLGETATRYQLWDAIRSLDYLAAHPLVDPTRLASAGQSGGATLTMLLGCVDERLAAAAVSSGNTENVAIANFNPPGSTDDAEQDLVGSGPLGFDRWDLLYPVAPKPLLVEVSSHDFFGTYSPRYLEDGREEYAKLARVYELLGHPEHLAWRSTPLPHGLTYGLRLEIYNWFERWLKNSERRIAEEPPVAPEPANLLWTGPTGSVVRDYNSLRPIDLIKQTTAAIHPSGGTPFRVAPLRTAFRELAVTRFAGSRVAAVEVNSAPAVWIPAWLFTPEKSDTRESTLLVLDSRGRNAGAHEDDLYHRLARAGHRVCAADVRGMGDSRPETGRGNSAYTIPHESEEDFAWASLILGDSLLAQRVTDILALMQALKTANRPLALAARGRLSVPALFAFAASTDVASLYLAGGLASFRSVLETEIYSQPLSNFAWDLFRRTDLPLLVAQSAPRRIHLAGAVDASERPVAGDALRQIYSTENVTISELPNWDEHSLGAA
jgi:dienelactone hydrolase/pimeloyl-ACP methyl ester carboxylesterase